MKLPWNTNQGCDASVLLSGSNSEQIEIPNQTLRPEALKLIDDIRATVHDACGPTVSCADITTLATRDAVVAVSRRPAVDPIYKLAAYLCIE